MFDTPADILVDGTPPYDSRQAWGRLIALSLMLYIMGAFYSWEELRFRWYSIDVAGTVDNVDSVTRGRNRNRVYRVRYRFQDPTTGRERTNSVYVSVFGQWAGSSVDLQFIPGENSQSRLASQARPGVMKFFFGLNATVICVFLGYIGFLTREANYREPNTPEQARKRFLRRRKIEAELDATK